MRIGSRRSLFDWEYFDPDAVAYLKKAKITDQKERYLVNQLVTELKHKSFWDRFERIWLMSPTSEYASTVCTKSLELLTPVNSPDWNSSGWQMDNNTQYLNSNFSVTNDGTVTSYIICTQGVWISPGCVVRDLDVWYVCGARSNNRMYLYEAADIGQIQAKFFAAGRQAVEPLHSGLNFEGHITGVCRGASNREIFVNGSSVALNTVLGPITPGGIPYDMYVGCYNQAGTATFGAADSITGRWQLYYIASQFTQAEMAILHSIFNSYQKQIGRYSI